MLETTSTTETVLPARGDLSLT